MATFRKRGTRWRAELFVKGQRRSATFATKREAQAWAAQTEAKIHTQSTADIPDKSFGDLMHRYADEVSVRKRGARRERMMIQVILRDTDIAKIPLRDLRPSDLSAWRERRLEQVSAGTVIREMTILSHACTIARKEWGWLKTNPMADVRRPASPQARTRRPTEEEIEALLFTMGYSPDRAPETAMARVGAAFLFACETAMRAGEICALQWDDVHERYVHLPMTKNGHPRDVPLSTQARRIIEQLRPVTGKHPHVFNLPSTSLDALFRRARERLAVDGPLQDIRSLHFHDTRREALTRLSKVFNVMELARISGHRDLRILQNVYYAPKVEDLADKLA
ncbi:tyrosine-type recombinase/integrase [Acidihalobacter ferrooxydans]|uniref:Tyr recombinase domain-containing protein n=1 Tax=Acidihalobacter ferrooxydans TaxID=1765967 RepID=A0A1P8UFR5_9GAMM|nr:site-specific integrase [Acidihalobacter ferrooxydans]APZ42649.1 hypothetical protein BW247_05670 [Acidihalobacter ferrooxydans]